VGLAARVAVQIVADHGVGVHTNVAEGAAQGTDLEADVEGACDVEVEGSGGASAGSHGDGAAWEEDWHGCVLGILTQLCTIHARQVAAQRAQIADTSRRLQGVEHTTDTERGHGSRCRCSRVDHNRVVVRDIRKDQLRAFVNLNVTEAGVDRVRGKHVADLTQRISLGRGDVADVRFGCALGHVVTRLALGGAAVINRVPDAAGVLVAREGLKVGSTAGLLAEAGNVPLTLGLCSTFGFIVVQVALEAAAWSHLGSPLARLIADTLRLIINRGAQREAHARLHLAGRVS